jgi:hypothetical protein
VSRLVRVVSDLVALARLVAAFALEEGGSVAKSVAAAADSGWCDRPGSDSRALMSTVQLLIGQLN